MDEKFLHYSCICVKSNVKINCGGYQSRQQAFVQSASVSPFQGLQPEGSINIWDHDCSFFFLNRFVDLFVLLFFVYSKPLYPIAIYQLQISVFFFRFLSLEYTALSFLGKRNSKPPRGLIPSLSRRRFVVVVRIKRRAFGGSFLWPM